MILTIRNSRITKTFSVSMIFVFLATLNPLGSYALTGGPAQPEFNSFTPIGTSDMVDLASGDFSYNIPLMDIGGFPINLAYSSGVSMDQEASWVGLGWDLSIGQINRQMRGLPDDFSGEQMQYENNMKDNYTIGASFTGSPAVFGFDMDGVIAALDGELSLGISGQYNSYDGISLKPSMGLTFDVAQNASIGLNVSSGPDGLTVSPNASLHAKYDTKKFRDNTLGGKVGISFNSRQGLSSLNLSASRSPGINMNKKKPTKHTSGSIGSSISFVDNYYTPTVQDGLTSVNFTFNAGTGVEIFGAEAQGHITAFGSNQFLLDDEKNKTESAFGYDNTHLATTENVLDFNREKDGNFSVNSNNLALTNYTYDIYSVQGQGVSGMFRPYRSQVGYVNDNETNNYGGGGALGLEAGAGNTAHIGADIEVTVTSSHSGAWIDGNLAEPTFKSDENDDPLYEEVYFKNVGDLSVDNESEIYGGQSSNLGGYYPAHLEVSGSKFNRGLSNRYDIKDAELPTEFETSGELSEDDLKRDERVKRNQSILKVSYKEANDYEEENGEPLTGFRLNTGLGISGNQTAGFVVTRNDGARYVYGEALYNTKKREVTFALGDEVGGDIGGLGEDGILGDPATGLVEYEGGDNSIDNEKGDRYFNATTTPAYAHTYLLTTLLSSDYSDADLIAGPSVNDYGSYTTFEYRDMGKYRWRVPFGDHMANYNEGIKTDPTDDKGSYVYGEKETSYIQKIETKTHVALFYVSPRMDGHGVSNQNGAFSATSEMYKLDKIALYSRGEFYKDDVTTTEGGEAEYYNIETDATPIKTVHFEYGYDLCQGIPNNDSEAPAYAMYDHDNDGETPKLANEGGKLTLKKVYFTYRNSNMGKFSAYNFTYGDSNHDGTLSVDELAKRNPEYNLKGYDLWGNFKPNYDYALDASPGEVLDALTAPEFAYVDQADDNLNDKMAAWSITDIELPSGGNIQIDYESDDYQYVQDKQAMQMFKLAGAGHHPNPTTAPAPYNSYFSNTAPNPVTGEINQTDNEALLYKIGPDKLEAKYLYFELATEDQPEQHPASVTDEEFRKKYLDQITREQGGLIQFRFFTNMNHKGGKNSGDWDQGKFDYITGYFEFDSNLGYTVFEDDGKRYGSVRMTTVDMEGGPGGSSTNVNPISKTGWHYGRKYIPKYIYGLPEPDAGSGGAATVNMILGSVNGLTELLTGPNGLLRTKEMARRFIPEKSWIRLSNPSGTKKGGGSRVKQLAMTDEWDNMTSDEVYAGPLRGQKYGQEYTYDLEDGTSSGVATYEPVGGKENPLVQPVFVNVNRLLAPDEENYMEKPFGESFFPSPTITYSRVAVKNLERYDDKDTPTEVDDEFVKKYATGEVVTHFYTSKDYPVQVDQTEMTTEEDEPGILGNLLNINHKKHLTLSQGYLIHLNDMNGKMRSQRVYAEGQPDYISGVDYFYDGFSTLDIDAPDPFTLASHNIGALNNEVNVLYPDGEVKLKTLGVEFDIINDFREKTSETEIVGVNTNVATFFIGMFPGVVPLPVPDYAHHEDKLNMSTTTKIINTFGIQREVVAHDAGASVYTRNLLWDSETGEVLLTETVNEYGDKYYSLNFPAHWYYKNMGQASGNSGTILEIQPDGSNFKLGDDVPGFENDYLINGDEVLLSDYDDGLLGLDFKTKAWVHNVSGTNFELMDEEGDGIDFGDELTGLMRIHRSGKRNIQSTSMGSVVLMNNPLDFLESGYLPADFLATDDWSEYKIVNAGAVDFSDDWARQCECGVDVGDENFNPYVQNTKGVWRAKKSWLYLTGRHQNIDDMGVLDDALNDPVAEDQVDIRNDGFYRKFSHYYKLVGSNWTKAPADWKATSEVSQFSSYGFELENKDALDRYSAAQYGYNFSFPLAVGANARYSELGYDGFEDYGFDGCPTNEHFGFRDVTEDLDIIETESHTGRHSLKVAPNSKIIKIYSVDCQDEE